MAERVRALAAAQARERVLAAAVGHQRTPNQPSSAPAPEQDAEPFLVPGNRTVVSAGDWKGRAKHAAVKCGVLPGDPPGVGRCTNPCDQLYNTCPLPKDLPLGRVPPPGGPVGSDPVVQLPPSLTPADVTLAVKAGRLRMPVGFRLAQNIAAAVSRTATYAASTDYPAASSPAGLESARAFAEAVSAGAISINAGDSWAVRNTNCQIAPIHGILNRVCPTP